MTIIQLKDVLSDPEFNCRGEIDAASVTDLATSIKTQGLLQPILVVKNPETGPLWKCIAGHRRIAACRQLDWIAIPAVIKEFVSDQECRKVNFQENMARKDLTPSQDLRAILAIYGEAPDRAQVASELGVSRKWVNDRLRLRVMEPRILDKVDEGLLGALDLQYLSTALPGERWNMAQMLMEKKAAGVSSKAVARELKLRTKSRTLIQMRKAREVLLDYGRTPSWVETMGWCAGEVSSEEFFGMSFDKLKEYGILE